MLVSRASAAEPVPMTTLSCKPDAGSSLFRETLRVGGEVCEEGVGCREEGWEV